MAGASIPPNAATSGKAAPEFTQFTGMNLAADFQTDNEEENCHQAIVDPEMQIALKRERAQMESDGNMPETDVRLTPGRIGPYESGNCGDYQKNATRGLDCEKSLHGS